MGALNHAGFCFSTMQASTLKKGLVAFRFCAMGASILLQAHPGQEASFNRLECGKCSPPTYKRTTLFWRTSLSPECFGFPTLAAPMLGCDVLNGSFLGLLHRRIKASSTEVAWRNHGSGLKGDLEISASIWRYRQDQHKQLHLLAFLASSCLVSVVGPVPDVGIAPFRLPRKIRVDFSVSLQMRTVSDGMQQQDKRAPKTTETSGSSFLAILIYHVPLYSILHVIYCVY